MRYSTQQARPAPFGDARRGMGCVPQIYQIRWWRERHPLLAFLIMGSASDAPPSQPAAGGYHTSHLNTLRWLAIVLPVGYLVAIDLVRNMVFSSSGWTVWGYIAAHGLIAVGVAIFSITIFRIIAYFERQSAVQNARLMNMALITSATSQNLEVQDVMEVALEKILAVMHADAGLVCRVFLETGEHARVCARGLSSVPLSPPAKERYMLRENISDDPVALRVVTTGRPVLYSEMAHIPQVRQALELLQFRSGISVPLMLGGRVEGIAALCYRENRAFPEDEQTFLLNLGSQIAMAIRNASLYESSIRDNEDLQALVAVSAAVSSSLDLNRVLESALETITTMTSADAAETWLLEENELVMRCHCGAERESFFPHARVCLGEGVPGTVAATRERILTHDLATDSRFVCTALRDAGFRSFVAFPLVYQGNLMGVMAVAAFREDALSDANEIHLLEAIGRQVTPAVANARLHQEIQSSAILQERQRISREMHDGLGQILAYVNTQALAIHKFVADGRLDEASSELEKLETAARQVYADVRDQILALRVVPRSSDGAIGALREYTDLYEQMFGIETTFRVDVEAESARIDPASEIQLIRIVQEALSNVRKHASAKRVDVTVVRDPGGLRIEIADDGHGFDPDRLPAARHPRFGLQTMRERAAAVRGTFAVTSVPGRGTCVTVTIPPEKLL